LKIIEGVLIMNHDDLTLATKLIHAGEIRPGVLGAVSLPIFQSAMFEYAGAAHYHDIKYIRLNNTPNHTVLHAKLAALENAGAALVAASGMAAITTGILSLLSAGDRILAQESLYGGTHDFFTKHLGAFGIACDFLNIDDPASWPARIKPGTKAVYVETISNPLMQVPDLEAVVTFARAHGLVSMIDNTFATPVNFRPAEHGFDLSFHSVTKYLNGHSDIVGGAVIGRADLVEAALLKLDTLGGSMDPHACFLLHRGLKTLALRVRFQNESALRIARVLAGHPAVARVNYPGLEDHPGHARAARLFDGFGGMLSFELAGGVEAAERFMGAVRLPIIAPSLGSVETLMTRPATTSHLGMSPEDRKRIGISDGLIRLSVGIEATEDLIRDFERALV
jgi:cystathionine beta-lyase/cystathionine gamma-synthase